MKIDHDCGWLECTVLSCAQARYLASDDGLRQHNINRDGTPLGLAECGDVHPGNKHVVCRKVHGHEWPRHVSGLAEWGPYTNGRS